MSVGPGTRIGPYDVISMLGAGGMGEVYRARDSRLDRSVAVKILAESFANDPERLARFEREAKTLASLNHPNIAVVHGFEEAHGIQALVMELVEGPTLADRIRQGSIPLDEALPIARQVADALEAAHEQGIIHRDLKPANIKVRADGTVKVLDFGLAKVLEPIPDADATSSPTITSPALTRIGVILGTAAYMSPEQARGKRADKRSDVWAFGCVLYEMLTGQAAFPGNTTSDTIAKILEREPDWAALPDGLPVSIRRLLQRCLRKDPGLRLHDIADARIEIDEALDSAVAIDDVKMVSESRRPESRSSWRLLRLAALLAAGVGVGVLASRMVNRPEVAVPRPVRLVETLAPGREMPPGHLQRGTIVAVSPDGLTLVYSAHEKGQWRLFSRSLDQLDQRNATPIGDVDARNPFFSHDGQWIVFWAGSSLKRVPARGGPAQLIAEVPAGFTQGGGNWNADGTILVGSGSWGLQRVSESGRSVDTLLAAPEGRGIWYPQLLPDGRSVLYTESETSPNAGELMVFDLETRRTRRVHRGAAGRYLRTGHLVYVAEGTLWGIAFDLDRLEVRGTPVPLIAGIRVTSEGGAVQLALSETGVVAYVPAASVQRTLVWVDQQGKETPVGVPHRAYSNPRVSPDGTQILVTMRDEGLDVHVWDLARRMLRQLTFDSMHNYTAAWLDSQRLAFWASATLRPQVSILASDGSSGPRRLTKEPDLPVFPMAASRDGKLLLVMEVHYNEQGNSIAVIPIENPDARRTLVTRANNPVVSPDSRWLAYQSGKTGRQEIYVRPFPELGEGDIPVTTEGGRCPVWARDGSELYYWKDIGASASIWAVRIRPGPPSNWGPPTLVVKGPYVSISSDTSYDVWGGRFLVMKDVFPDGERPRDEVVIVLNWFEELKRRVPTK